MAKAKTTTKSKTASKTPTKKTAAKKTAAKKAGVKKIAHPGMMGDGTEEQNLGQRGNPAARIKKSEVKSAFGKPAAKAKKKKK